MPLWKCESSGVVAVVAAWTRVEALTLLQQTNVVSGAKPKITRMKKCYAALERARVLVGGEV